jgi:NAD(P)-dependent dehydrogenase (short-subunit alcohol dehydrogenase family)
VCGSGRCDLWAVAPTFIYTPGTADRLDTPAYRQGVLDRLPIGRVGTIADVAAAVIYIHLSVNGQNQPSCIAVRVIRFAIRLGP